LKIEKLSVICERVNSELTSSRVDDELIILCDVLLMFTIGQLGLHEFVLSPAIESKNHWKLELGGVEEHECMHFIR